MVSILENLLNLLAWRQPARRTTRKPMRRTRKPGLECYDFSDSGALMELVDQIEKGKLPRPQPVREPDFGSYSPKEAARRIRENIGITMPKGKPPPAITHWLTFSPGQESLIADSPVPKNTYKPELWPFAPEATFRRPHRGRGLTKIQLAELNAALDSGPDFADSPKRPKVRRPSPWKSFEHMMGIKQGGEEPPKVLTPQDIATRKMRHEAYDFGS